MKITFKESSPGEFDVGADELRDKVEAAAGAALEKMLSMQGCAGHLCKARLPRGGEIQLIEDLTQILAKAYERRLTMLSKAIVEATHDSE